MKQHRLARVAEAIRETASETILFELNDPRIKDVTVTRAEISADLQHAKVYVSIMGSERDQAVCLSALKHARGFLQRKIGDRLQTRFTPQVQLVVDKGVKHSIKIAQLIKEALATTNSPGSSDSSPSKPPSEDKADGTATEESVDD
jgi:ribosome-binding factor A